MTEREPYEVLTSSSADKDVEDLSPTVQGRILDKMEALGGEPRPRGAKKLRATEDLYRIRVGDFRIIYDIDDAGRKVVIHGVKDRKEAYRRGIG